MWRQFDLQSSNQLYKQLCCGFHWPWFTKCTSLAGVKMHLLSDFSVTWLWYPLCYYVGGSSRRMHLMLRSVTIFYIQGAMDCKAKCSHSHMMIIRRATVIMTAKVTIMTSLHDASYSPSSLYLNGFSLAHPFNLFLTAWLIHSLLRGWPINRANAFLNGDLSLWGKVCGSLITKPWFTGSLSHLDPSHYESRIRSLWAHFDTCSHDFEICSLFFDEI